MPARPRLRRRPQRPGRPKRARRRPQRARRPARWLQPVSTAALLFPYTPLAGTPLARTHPEAKAHRYWFFTADPTRYHWDTLFVKGKELWNGVRNAAAQRYLKQVRKGDLVTCYHGPPARSVYALATVASEPYPDPYAPDERLLAVDLKAMQLLPRAVPFKEMKENRMLRRMRFLARPRLMVTPLTEHEYQEILRMAGLPPTLTFR